MPGDETRGSVIRRAIRHIQFRAREGIAKHFDETRIGKTGRGQLLSRPDLQVGVGGAQAN